MIYFPNAKVNLGLNIIAKRIDGFHEIETIFLPVKDCIDAIELLKSENLEFEILGNQNIGELENNLIMKAYKLIQTKFPERKFPLKIILHKKIPTQAGLGGGSADGAFMLIAMNHFFDLRIDTETLKIWALNLGSDCPFFIDNKICYATGRGEILTPIDLNLDNYKIEIIPSDINISTAWAFSKILPQKSNFDLKNIVKLPISEWKNVIKNDFEKNVFEEFPSLLENKKKLYSKGAIYSSLSGTGSSVYGIFEK